MLQQWPALTRSPHCLIRSYLSFEEMLAAAAAPPGAGPVSLLQQAAAAAAEAAAEARAAVSAATRTAGSGTDGGGAKPQRPWDSWGLASRGGQANRKHPKMSGLLWEVAADLASLGVSLVDPTHEVAYLRASGIRAELAGTAAHLALDLELRALQVGSGSCVWHCRVRSAGAGEAGQAGSTAPSCHAMCPEPTLPYSSHSWTTRAPGWPCPSR